MGPVVCDRDFLLPEMIQNTQIILQDSLQAILLQTLWCVITCSVRICLIHITISTYTFSSANIKVNPWVDHEPIKSTSHATFLRPIKTFHIVQMAAFKMLPHKHSVCIFCLPLPSHTETITLYIHPSLYFCGLFNTAVNTLDYTVLDVRMSGE